MHDPTTLHCARPLQPLPPPPKLKMAPIDCLMPILQQSAEIVALQLQDPTIVCCPHQESPFPILTYSGEVVGATALTLKVAGEQHFLELVAQPVQQTLCGLLLWWQGGQIMGEVQQVPQPDPLGIPQEGLHSRCWLQVFVEETKPVATEVEIRSTHTT